MPAYSFNTLPVNVSDGNIRIGVSLPATGQLNTTMGMAANISNTTGIYNTSFGVNASFSNTAGSFNSALGVSANYSNISGNSNTAFGVNANYSNTGNSNTAIGVNANYSNTTGGSNTAIGVNANSNIGFEKTGSSNTHIGANNNDSNLTTGSNNTFIGANITGNGNVFNTLVLSDGSNSQNIVADTSSVRTNRPIRPQGYTVSTLPNAVTSGIGALSYASNGRKAAETAGNGTGVPVWCDGSNWRTFYDNSIVLA